MKTVRRFFGSGEIQIGQNKIEYWREILRLFLVQIPLKLKKRKKVYHTEEKEESEE